MELLIVPVPLFNKDIAVEAYYFRHQKGNDIIEASRGPAQLDGAMLSLPLEMLNMISIDTFTMGKPIFVPITNYMLLAPLETQCSQPADKIIFLLDKDVGADEHYITNMIRLKKLGYRFGIQKIGDISDYKRVLELCDYIFYDYRLINLPEQIKLRGDISRMFGHIKCVYTHILTLEDFQAARIKFQGMFEGRFYRVPLTKGKHTVSPLQVNLINLLNLVRDGSFEFSDVSAIIQKDPALTISLLRLVNSPFIGLRNKVGSINQAVTMLGQSEVRKWITTAVAKLLGSDKPNEITRLSLVRAKFAENLASVFGLNQDAQGLFLMGLFSSLDAMLEMPMDRALQLVCVADEIYDALVESKGIYYPIFEFMLLYESADWTNASRLLILRDTATESVYNAYTQALLWYRDLMATESPQALRDGGN